MSDNRINRSSTSIPSELGDTIPDSVMAGPSRNYSQYQQFVDTSSDYDRPPSNSSRNSGAPILPPPRYSGEQGRLLEVAGQAYRPIIGQADQKTVQNILQQQTLTITDAHLVYTGQNVNSSQLEQAFQKDLQREQNNTGVHFSSRTAATRFNITPAEYRAMRNAITSAQSLSPDRVQVVSQAITNQMQNMHPGWNGNPPVIVNRSQETRDALSTPRR